MERIEKNIISLNEFELLEIQIKAKGGKIAFKWNESWSENNGALTWDESYCKEAHRLKNEAIFVLIDQMAEVLAKRAGVNVEEISLNSIKFIDCNDSVKSYDLGVKFKIAGEKETRAVSNITIQDLAHQSTVDYSAIEGLIVEMEYNAYAFCVLGQYFEDQSDAIEIERNGYMIF